MTTGRINQVTQYELTSYFIHNSRIHTHEMYIVHTLRSRILHFPSIALLTLSVDERQYCRTSQPIVPFDTLVETACSNHKHETSAAECVSYPLQIHKAIHNVAYAFLRPSIVYYVCI